MKKIIEINDKYRKILLKLAKEKKVEEFLRYHKKWENELKIEWRKICEAHLKNKTEKEEIRKLKELYEELLDKLQKKKEQERLENELFNKLQVNLVKAPDFCRKNFGVQYCNQCPYYKFYTGTNEYICTCVE